MNKKMKAETGDRSREITLLSYLIITNYDLLPFVYVCHT
jgi:hypothetical protein